jgi:hypothetical protein
MTITINGTTGVTYPAGGTDNVAGSGVGTTDTQTLTNKTLVASGSNTVEATSGPTSTQLAGMRNKIINGAMMIDQRNAGASVTVPTVGSVYPCDRFYVNRANGYANTATAQQVAAGPTGFKNSLKYTSGSAETVSGSLYSNIQQYIEGLNVADLGWGASGAYAVTLSFWVNISTTGTFGGSLRSADGTLSFPFSFSYSSANTWQYVTISVPGPTTGGTTAFPNNTSAAFSIFWDLGVGPTLSGSATGAWQSANYLGLTGGVKLNTLTGATFYITGVQLEKGATATPFENRLYGTELALCQRYYQIAEGFIGQTDSTTTLQVSLQYKTEMRASPSISASAVIQISKPGIADYSQSSASATINGSRVSTRGIFVNLANFSGLTAQNIYLHNVAVNNAGILLSAEL